MDSQTAVPALQASEDFLAQGVTPGELAVARAINPRMLAISAALIALGRQQSVVNWILSSPEALVDMAIQNAVPLLAQSEPELVNLDFTGSVLRALYAEQRRAPGSTEAALATPAVAPSTPPTAASAAPLASPAVTPAPVTPAGAAATGAEDAAPGAAPTSGAEPRAERGRAEKSTEKSAEKADDKTGGKGPDKADRSSDKGADKGARAAAKTVTRERSEERTRLVESFEALQKISGSRTAAEQAIERELQQQMQRANTNDRRSFNTLQESLNRLKTLKTIDNPAMKRDELRKLSTVLHQAIKAAEGRQTPATDAAPAGGADPRLEGLSAQAQRILRMITPQRPVLHLRDIVTALDISDEDAITLMRTISERKLATYLGDRTWGMVN